MATSAAVSAGRFQCLGRTRYGGAPSGIDHCWQQGLGPPLVALVSADPGSRARPVTPRSCVNRWVKWTPLTTAGTPSTRARGLEPAPQTVDHVHGPPCMSSEEDSGGPHVSGTVTNRTQTILDISIHPFALLCQRANGTLWSCRPGAYGVAVKRCQSFRTWARHAR